MKQIVILIRTTQEFCR